MVKKKLGDILVDAGVITPLDLQEALKVQSDSGKSLDQILCEMGLITPQKIIEVYEFQLGIPHVDLFRTNIDTTAVSLIPEHLARLHVAIPIELEGNVLKVAISDPLNTEALDDIRLSSGKEVKPVISTEHEILDAIDRYYSFNKINEKAIWKLNNDRVHAFRQDSKDDIERSGTAPVVRLVDSLIRQALRDNATDIHIEPQDKNVIVRYRIDGLLREVMRYPLNLHTAMATRIKILSGMDIAQKRLPQDGRMQFQAEGRDIDLRVSTLPTVYGEKVAVRILDRQRFFLKIDQLGFEHDSVEELRKMISSPYGMILVTGPTGSGKTTTLYSALKEINSSTQNIITLEDPVEYLINGINQVQVNPKSGLTFATGLRSILRQDPNVIMVGEIRDTETAKIAVQAALTGHLVFSTLHTNDSASALTRLIDMEVEPFLVASSVIGVVAQRLVRKICPWCITVYRAEAHEKAFLGIAPDEDLELYRGSGCPHCNNTGYSGRTVIYEILKVKSAHRELIMKKASAEEIKLTSKRLGMKTLLDTGKNKILSGITTIEEVLKTTW